MSAPVRSHSGGIETRVADLERKQKTAADASLLLAKADNLSDLASIPTARANLIPAGTLVNSQLANMAQATVKGRASGAGTGVPADLTAAQIKTILGAFAGIVGTSGEITTTGGMMLKFGSVAAGGDAFKTFDTAFPTVCVMVVASPFNTGAALPSTSLLAVTIEGVGTTGFTHRCRYALSGGTVGIASQGFNWVAIGI